MPCSSPAATRDNPKAPAIASPTPPAASSIPCRTTMARTCRSSAPSARRMPISRVRCVTLYAIALKVERVIVCEREDVEPHRLQTVDHDGRCRNRCGAPRREFAAGRSDCDFEIGEGDVDPFQIRASLLEGCRCGCADVRLDKSLPDQSDADVRVLAPSLRGCRE